MLALPATAQAHVGAPYPILLEEAVGPYLVSALADPDVGKGTFYVLVTLASYRRTGMERTRESLRAEKQTDWVIQGAHRIPFNVVEEKRTQY